MGFSTRDDLDVLCYQHHREMGLEPGGKSEGASFRCEEPGCLIRFNASRGYFLGTQDKMTLQEEILPRVFCSSDKSPMYLAETETKSKSYRLWKCPECGTSRTNEGISDGWGKTAGA
ncbi:MAG TPA: hypothetical protein VE778_02575 [Candidatus Bathyarchaeia archaeon]|nr:hypothetical protein [Candidatus Bathyarchaeia archaeon]